MTRLPARSVLSVNSGADTGGLSILMKRAFDRCSTWPFRSLIRSSNYIRYPTDAPWNPRVMRELVAEADVLHLHNSFRTLGMLPGRGEGKGLVIYHHGSQFRKAPAPQLREAEHRRAVALVSTLDLWAMAPKDTEWVPVAYNLEWLQQQRCEHYRAHEGLIIAHAPTDRTAKGTQALIAAVERLKGTYPISLQLIERRPWKPCLQMKATADVFVDQLLLGYGNNGVEAMGMGIPVISGVDVDAGKRLQPHHPELRVPPETADAMAQHWGDLPYLHATQDTITDVLEAMVAEKSIRDEFSGKGIAHARRFHSDEVVVGRLEKVYERSIERRGVTRQAGTIRDGSVVTIAAQTDGVAAPLAHHHPPADPTPHLPDVVYVVRPGERNEELRYSLRSLRNLPHGKVWISGYCPKWVTGVGVILTETKPGGHASAKANLRAACEHPEVSERFVYFNDDFFVMQPLETTPVMHRGPLADVIANDRLAKAYTRAMKETLAILTEQGVETPLMYDLHAPMMVTKAGMLEALDLCSYSMIQERTVYGNLQQVGGELRRNHKVYRMDRGWQSWSFLSTNDHGFRTHPVGQYIRSCFDTGSPYEADPPMLDTGYSQRPGTPRVGALPTPRRPIRRTAASTIRRVRPVGVPA